MFTGSERTHPLHVIRFCPRCGSAEFPAVSNRSFKCKKCGFHFFVNAAAAVAALIANENGQLLLTRRKIDPDAGKLDLPGGFADPGEMAEDALKRELWEELGLEVREMEYVGSRPNDYVFSGISVFTLDFAFKVIPEDLSNLKPMDDILDFGFYSFDQIDWEHDIPAPSIRFFARSFFEQ